MKPFLFSPCVCVIEKKKRTRTTRARLLIELQPILAATFDAIVEVEHNTHDQHPSQDQTERDRGCADGSQRHAKEIIQEPYEVSHFMLPFFLDFLDNEDARIINLFFVKVNVSQSATFT